MPSNLISRRHALAIAFTATTLLAIPVASAQQAPSDAIVGVWEADDGTVKLDMFKSGSEYQARLLWGNEVVEADRVTFKADTKNPDPVLRSRSLKNIVFVTGLHWNDGEWTGGSIYDGSSGRTYNCQIRVEGGKMHLRGYIGLAALGQTKTFHRAR